MRKSLYYPSLLSNDKRDYKVLQGFWPSSLNWHNLFRPGTSLCLKKSRAEYNTNDTLILREIMLNES